MLMQNELSNDPPIPPLHHYMLFWHCPFSKATKIVQNCNSGKLPIEMDLNKFPPDESGFARPLFSPIEYLRLSI